MQTTFHILLGLLLITTLVATVCGIKFYHNTNHTNYNICKIVLIVWAALLIATLISGKLHYDNKKAFVKGFVGLYQYINYVESTKDYDYYAEILEKLSVEDEDLLIFVAANGHKLKPEQSFELLKVYLVSSELQQTQIINTLKK